METRRLLTGIELISIDVSGDSAGGLPPPIEVATNPAVNATGRFVAFQSDATDLVPGLVDTNGGTDVFVRDRLLGITIPISVIPGASLVTGDSRSFDPSISDDGRFIAFGSAAGDLVTGTLTIDAPANVFVRDRDTDKDGIFDEVGAVETRLLSLNGLLTGDGGGIFGGPSGGDAFGFGVATLRPRISGDGRYVTFGSLADNLALGISDPNFTADIFRASTRGGSSPTMVSDDFEGETSGGNGVPLPASLSPDISRDGNVVVFVSAANNLVKDAEIGTEPDIYAHNFATRTTSLVSINFARDDGGDGVSEDPDVSSSGRYVAWESTATNLVAPGVNTNGLALDVYRRLLPGGPTELVSVNVAGKTGDGPSEDPSINDSGRYVAFESEATDLISDPAQLAAGVVDANDVPDVYVRDMLLGTTALVSINATGTAAGIGFSAGIGGASINPIISGSGRYVVFESFAEDLVAGLLVSGRNLFVRDLVAGTTRLVTSDIGGDVGDDGPNPISSTFEHQISRDGSVVAFTGIAADLVDPDTNAAPDVFASTGTPDLTAVLATSSRSVSDRISFIYDRVFPALIGPFEIGFYRSTDELFDPGDGAPLFTRPATGLSAMLAGFVYTLGPAAGLPGAGVPDDDEDYSLLAVVDHLGSVVEDDADEFNEDNTTPFVADYQVAGMPWMVHGTSEADVISYSTPTGTTLELVFNARDRTLPLASVPTTRIRAHGGDDVVTGSPLGDFIHGGDGDDTLFGGDGDDTIADGMGDDTIDGGLGDDTIISTPGSDDIFIDGGGNDTLDFSQAFLPITIDLDSEAIQTVDAAGNTIRLIGKWENYIGTDLDDDSTVFIKPLLVPRSLNGGAGHDRLVFNALGNSVTFDGTKFIIPGFGDVTVSGFEDIQTINTAARTIDDEDQGYADTGFGFEESTQGYKSDVRFSAANSGNVATWQFADLAPGTYAVAATWTFAGDRAKNSPFTIRDGGANGTIVKTVLVNQEQNPGEFDPVDDVQNILFRNLGIVQITSHELTVQLTDVGADQFVAADAIRIEPVTTRHIIDNGDPGFVSSGFDPQVLANNAGGRGALGDVHLGQDVNDTALYQFTDLAPGRYSVAATWTAAPDRATNAPLKAVNGANDEFSAEVNQQLAPDDFVELGISWKRLLNVVVGPDGQLTIDWSLFGGTTGTVVADAVRLDPAPDVQLFSPSGLLVPYSGQLAENGELVNDQHTTRFEIRNPGSAHLDLGSVSVSNGAFSVSLPPEALVIPPGGLTHFEVTLTAGATGSFNSDVFIPHNGFGNNPFFFSLQVNIVDDALPPTVTIVAPADDTTMIAGTTLPIRAQVFDDLGVQRVDFLVDGLVVATDTTAPFGFDFNPTVDALRVITATAVDFGNNSVTSSPINIEVLPDQPPVVEIVVPDSGEHFMHGQPIFVQVEATDDVAIQRVEFLRNSVVVEISDFSTGGIFFGQIDFPLTGTSVQLQARAVDSAGQKTTTEILNLPLFDDTPPQVQIVSPGNGTQLVEGTTQEVRVNATDDNGIRRIELYVNNVMVAEAAQSPLLFNLNVPVGATNFVIQAKAFDELGNEQQSTTTNASVVPRPPGAVVVSQQGKKLRIVGSGQNDQLQIIAIGPGHLRIIGSEGTTVNGGVTPIECRNVTSVAVELADGSDYLEFTANPMTSSIPKTSVNLGSGDDHLRVNAGQFAGDLTVSGGAGNDSFEAVDAVFHKLNFAGGEGNDEIQLTNSRVNRLFETSLEGGDDQLRAVNSAFSNKLQVFGGTGRDRVELTQVNIAKTTQIDTGSGDDDDEVIATDTTFSRAFNVLVGDGNNTVDCLRIQAQASAQILAGRGNDTLKVRDSNLKRLQLLAGLGDNLVDLAGTLIERQ